MKYFVWFIISFFIIYTIYYFLFIRKATRNGKHSAEVDYLIKLYKIDITKFSYYKFVRVVGIISSIDIALVALMVMFINGFVFQLLFSILFLVPVVILSFMILGDYYKKKELKNNKKELEKERLREKKNVIKKKKKK